MGKKWKNIKQLLFGTSKSVIQTSFEFPRQQKEDEEAEAANPEVMEFKASQKLLNSNQSTAEVNDEKDNEALSSSINKDDKNSSSSGNIISSPDIVTSEKPDKEENSNEYDENADSDSEEIDAWKEVYEELLPISKNNEFLIEKEDILIETLVTEYDKHIAQMKEDHKAIMEKLATENPAIRETIKNLKIDLNQIESDYFNEKIRHQKEIAALYAELREINCQEKEELNAKVVAESLKLADGIIRTIYDDEINLSEFSMDDEPHEEKEENKEKEKLQAKIDELDVTISEMLSIENVNV